MEILLRSEIFYKSPEFHEAIRKQLIKCTDCIISNCEKNNLENCVQQCMQPCVEFKLDYETKKSIILEDLKHDMIEKCINSPEKETCIQKINTDYLHKISFLFSSYNTNSN